MPTGSSELDPMELVAELSALPHRGATTDNERRAAELLAARLEGLGAVVTRERFLSPRTYVSIVAWIAVLVGGGLLVQPLSPAVALGATAVGAALAIQFLDWRDPLLARLPPRHRSENLVARLPPEPGEPAGAGRARLLLVAHYDTAMASLLYLPGAVKGFRRSVLVNAVLLVAAPLLVAVETFVVDHPALGWARIGLAAYLVLQVAVTAFDFVRYGFVNGAADNATGTGAAVAAAARLWADRPRGLEVEVLLTSAEEVGMIGAAAYVRAHRRELDPERTFVLNLDSLGAGRIGVVTRSGAITDLVYDNVLTRAALAVAGSDERLSGVSPVTHRTGDFDSAPFLRAGVPAVTFVAHDESGGLPHLHRPSDVLAGVEPAVPRLAVELACGTARRLAAELAGEPRAELGPRSPEIPARRGGGTRPGRA